MEDKKISCSVCAWRATCRKRFTGFGNAALHCPDFTFDLMLKKKDRKKENLKKDEGR